MARLFLALMAALILKSSFQQIVIDNCATLPVDLAYCMDGSGSIDGVEFSQEKEFMKLLLESIWGDNVGNNYDTSTFVGVTQFDQATYREFGVSPHGDVDDVGSLIDRIAQRGGGTNIAACLRDVCTTDDRSVPGLNVPKLVITVTDGDSNPQYRDAEAPAVDACHEAGWILAAIGVGGATEDRLDALSSTPELAQIETDFDTLIDQAGAIFSSLCQVLAVDLPRTVTLALTFNSITCSSVTTSFIPNLITEIQQAICGYYNGLYAGTCGSPSDIQVVVAEPIQCGSVHVDLEIPENQALGTANEIAGALAKAVQQLADPSFEILNQNPVLECTNPLNHQMDHFHDCQPQCVNSVCRNQFAACVENYCGGCHAIWYDANGVSDCSPITETSCGMNIGDTFVRNAVQHSDLNYGSEVKVYVKDDRNTFYNRRGLLKFDISSCTSLQSFLITLRLWQLADVGDPLSMLYVYSGVIGNTFSEHEVTWNTQPSRGELLCGDIQGEKGGAFECDVTDAVRTFQEASQPSIYFVLYGEFTGGAGTAKACQFHSKEASPDLSPALIFKSSCGSNIGDTFVRNAVQHSDVNYGNEEKVTVKDDRDTFYNRRGLLKFDIASCTSLQSFKITLRLWQLDQVDPLSMLYVYAGVIGNTFSEHEVTWNTQPPRGGLICGDIQGEKGGTFECDVTDAVRIFREALEPSIYFVLYGEYTGGAGTAKHCNFHSKEASPDVSPALIFSSQ